MGEICIPLPVMKDGQKAEISILLPEKEETVTYRIEAYSFRNNKLTWTTQNNNDIYNSLKRKIDHYDAKWELLQINAPEGDNNLIKVLYRKR